MSHTCSEVYTHYSGGRYVSVCGPDLNIQTMRGARGPSHAPLAASGPPAAGVVALPPARGGKTAGISEIAAAGERWWKISVEHL